MSHRVLEPAFLSGDFGSADAVPVAFEASDPDNADATFSALDTLTVRFDMPTDRGRYAGGRAFVDNLLQFSDQLGVDYTGQWADASTLTVTALATHPNFVGFTEAGGEAETLAAPSSRCRWGEAPNPAPETTPVELDAMGVTCFSAAHETTLRRPLARSTPATSRRCPPAARCPWMHYHPPAAAFAAHGLEPAGGIREGGTLVTVRSDYDAFIDGFDQLSRHAGDDTPTLRAAAGAGSTAPASTRRRP